MAKKVNVAGGTYTEVGDIRIYAMTVALTANSTVITGARAGDKATTTNATGRNSFFTVDGSSKVQYLTNA